MIITVRRILLDRWKLRKTVALFREDTKVLSGHGRLDVGTTSRLRKPPFYAFWLGVTYRQPGMVRGTVL